MCYQMLMNKKKPTKLQPSISNLSGPLVGLSELSKIGSDQRPQPPNSAIKSASFREAQQLLALLAAKILSKNKVKNQ